MDEAIEAAARGIDKRLRLACPLTVAELVACGCADQATVDQALARLMRRGRIEQLGRTPDGEVCYWTPAQAAAERAREDPKAQ